MDPNEIFELKATDLGGRIGSLKTKTSEFETPALLPVIHPARQLIPCKEIGAMGYEAVITNAYTTFRQLRNSANRGIHSIIDYDGSVMTDSGGYQVLEYGSVDIGPEEMAKFEELLGSDIAVVLDKPTGLEVTRQYATHTVDETLKAAQRTKMVVDRGDIIWSLPIQGGKYLDLVSKSAKSSATLDYGCYALGSPVEVMEGYDFSLLVRMILAAKRYLPRNRPFHLFGAGHPLVIPLAVALGCDLFDSASYILYAKQDRYISQFGTIRADELRYLGCSCVVCRNFKAKELASLPKDERVAALARHNLALLKSVIEQTKQSISEGRLWEYVQSATRTHPRALEAFRVAALANEKDSAIFGEGTPLFKDSGLFCFERIDNLRPELRRFRDLIGRLDIKGRRALVILPETKTKPFLKSEIFEESAKILSGNLDSILLTFPCPNVGLVPAELSDIYPLSQSTNSSAELPRGDPILHNQKWKRIVALFIEKDGSDEEWLRSEIPRYFTGERRTQPGVRKNAGKKLREKRRAKIVHSYGRLKQELRYLSSSID